MLHLCHVILCCFIYFLCLFELSILFIILFVFIITIIVEHILPVIVFHPGRLPRNELKPLVVATNGVFRITLIITLLSVSSRFVVGANLRVRPKQASTLA